MLLLYTYKKKKPVFRFITYYSSKAFYDTKTKQGKYTSAQRENNKHDFGIERVSHCEFTKSYATLRKK